jgi:hypothetical protein
MWNCFFITYNPHFKEYHVIRNASGCSVFSSSSKMECQKWIAQNGQPIQLELF